MILPQSLLAKPLATAILKATPYYAAANLPTAVTAATSSVVGSTSMRLLSSCLSTALVLSGGGKQEVMDIHRFKLRLDGLNSYSVITTLIINASMRLYSATPKRFDEYTSGNPRTDNIIKVLFSLLVTISILSGSYTTIVFSLMELYSKRALGRGGVMDAACLHFFDETQPIREWAYDTWILSLVSFQASFVLSLILNHDDTFRWILASLGTVAAVLCWWKWSTVMTMAAAILHFGADM